MGRRVVVLLLGGALLLGAMPGVAFAERATGPEGKLHSQIRRLIADQQQGRPVRPPGQAAGLKVDAGARVLVDVYVDGEAGQAAGLLRQAGMDVQAATNKAPVHMVEGWLPVAAATHAAALGAVRAVVPVVAYGTDRGSVQSQGDAAHNGPQARALDPSGALDGRFVKVGVISDSFDRLGGYFDDVSSSDLPDLVHVIKEGPAGSIDEGRAMMQIIADEAPGIAEDEFFFASGTVSGPADKANSINQLTFAGVNIIADDIFYLTEPFFQDGAVAQAVDNARANGVAYFASAGNRARQSYEFTYNPSTTDPGFHNFSYLSGEDTTQTITNVPNGSFIEPVLQWDEPWGHAETDLDVSLVNTTTGAVLAQDLTDNISTGIPMADVFWSNNTGATVSVGIRIRRFAGERLPFMKYIVRASGNMQPFTIADWDTSSNTINPDAASANGAITVAAVPWNDFGLNDPEGFSSRGRAFRLFDKNGVPLPASAQFRQKPNVAGADGVSTTVAGFGTFFGTSAATPSVAGVAALVKSARRSMSVGELSLFVQNPANAIDCNLAGRPDTDCGMGFVLADLATRQALTPGITSLSPASGATNVFQNASVVAGFNEAMDKPATQSAFTLKRTSTGATVAGSFVWFGNALVFDPSSNLVSGAQYTATVTTAARSTLGFNLPATRTWTFTVTNRPVIQSISPANNATGVSRSVKPVVGFTKAMDKTATQAAFSLKRTSTGTAVGGSFTWFGDALIFTPSSPLAASTRYTAAVSAAAKDTAGNTLLNPTTWSFTTGA